MDRQHSFRPSSRDVHDLICAEDHRGKSPAAYVEHFRVARATKFFPHPAILSRLYDFLFGVCGLSVLHFRRFDLTAQQEQANANHFNARNFSASVELPKLTGEPCLGDLKAALGVLGTYCNEFFDGHTCRLVAEAKEFAEERSDYESWSHAEVSALAFWCSNGLAAYRLACEYDIDHQTSTHLRVQERFTLHDRELSGMLLQLSRQSWRGPIYTAQHAEPQSRAAFGGKPYSQPPTSSSTPTATSKRTVPVEVGLVVPREEDGKQSCLRFISKKGCPSTSSTRCTHPFLAHFVPKEKIDPVIKKHVQDKLGGLRSDLFHLRSEVRRDTRVSLTLETVVAIQGHLEEKLRCAEQSRQRSRRDAFAAAGVNLPTTLPSLAPQSGRIKQHLGVSSIIWTPTLSKFCPSLSAVLI
ncbi:hypothetical protein PPTG_09381 [Phytophthora nicotianae INRA-310]|uniref:Uncharacterized protein n=1 Tax=Phytophthora nicotianae (strain INRA-310) TaxID=761204 RepID=W2QHA8_PHYN3|nr:hypothetical protein PPTG_09381 [Phytophthora nicotianae INRA-310]ETN11665.1 hypothetical protein PPTG_09381 [Phytophthora nicotianae INRA-310]